MQQPDVSKVSLSNVDMHIMHQLQEGATCVKTPRNASAA